MTTIPCPLSRCTYDYHPTGPHSYQVEHPRAREEWITKGVEVATSAVMTYRDEMFNLGHLPRESKAGTPLADWTLTDKINMRDGAVGLIADLCHLMVEMGEGSQELVTQAVKSAYDSA